MATTTSNLGLTKPAYADTADIEVINGNMDILDGAVNSVEGGIAIISNNNTHAAVAKGQYVYVRKHGSLSEGIYKAKSNISANATLSTSNLDAVSGGLGGEVASVAGDMLTKLLAELSPVQAQRTRFHQTGRTVKQSPFMFLYKASDLPYDVQ